MIPFVAAAGLLVLLAVGLLLVRREPAPRAADRDDPNLAWYRAREAELAGADPVLVEEARLRLLEDGALASAQGRSLGAGRFPVLALALVVAAGAALIYWRTGAYEDVLIYRDLRDLDPQAGDATRVALLQRIAARSAARPDNLQYLSLLGRLYMAGEDYVAASEAFARLAERAPEDPQSLALAAQSRFLAAGRQLDAGAQLLAEQALAVDPEQGTALGLLGMASFERGDYRAAVIYWERLRALEAPGSPGHDMLGEVITMARQRGGIEAAVAQSDDGTGSAPPAADPGPGISVSLRLAESIQADPAAVVFVFARPADRGGMPVAARRLQAADLPLTLRLSDLDAMAGQRLSEAGEVVVTAQLSANGQPGEANALYTGVAGPVAAGDDATVVSIELSAPRERS